MAEVYGHRWTSAYGADPNDGAALTWAKGLAGLGGDDLATGLKACIAAAESWPPTLPEFRAMCLGIPTLARVKLELLSHDDDRTPFTRFVWGLIDGHRYRQATADVADRMLRDAYDLASEERMRGAPLPERPVAAIVDDSKRKPVPATREQVAKHLAEIELALAMPGQKLSEDAAALQHERSRVEPLSDEARALQQQLEGRQS